MYTVIYLYRVPRRHREEFLEINRRASEIYRKHGALTDMTLLPVDLGPKYGCMGMAETLPTREDEEILLELVQFQDEAHHDEVMKKVDADPEIGELYRRVTRLIDISRVVRGVFTENE